jgi:hypothetical protein
MKKVLLNTSTLILLLLYTALYILAGKSSGFIMPSLLIIFSFLGFYFAKELPTKNGVYDKGIYFNQNEFYFYFPIIIIDIFSVLYYYNLSPELQQFNNNNYALLFLLFSILFPSILLFVFIFKNKSDRVIIYEENIYWSDNKNEFALTYVEIKSLELKTKKILWIIPQHYILIKLNSDHELTIDTYKMNITKSGTIKIYNYINTLHSNAKSFIDLKSEAGVADKTESDVHSVFEIIKNIAGYLIGKICVYLFARGLMYLFYLLFKAF